MIIIKRKQPILVGIIYYIPDYTNIVNEFYCQFDDVVPEIPRVHQFLNFWKDNIQARIKQVNVSTTSTSQLIKADFYGVIN